MFLKTVLLFSPFFHVQRLNENLGKLTAKFEKATSDKLKCQQEAEATACTIALANRLVSVSRCDSDGMNGRYQVLLRCEPCAHSTLHPLIFLEYISCTAASFSNENDFALAVFIHQGRHCLYLKRLAILSSQLSSPFCYLNALSSTDGPKLYDSKKVS